MSFYHEWDTPRQLNAPKKFDGPTIYLVVDQIKAGLGDLYKAAEQVGSSYILGEGQDLDIVVCLKDDGFLPIDHAEKKLECIGYTLSRDGSGDAEDDNFRCFRKGDVNVMLTIDEEWYWNFIKAAEVCKALGLTEKWQRIAVHRVIMDDEDAETAVSKAREIAG